MTSYAEKKAKFIEMFKNDPEIRKIPLPDSVREELNIWQDISYMKPNEAVNKCLFSGNRYDSMEEIKQEPIDFPDLTKLAIKEETMELEVKED